MAVTKTDSVAVPATCLRFCGRRLHPNGSSPLLGAGVTRQTMQGGGKRRLVIDFNGPLDCEWSHRAEHQCSPIAALITKNGSGHPDHEPEYHDSRCNLIHLRGLTAPILFCLARHRGRVTARQTKFIGADCLLGRMNFEPLRVCRRLQLLRGWSHYEADKQQVFA